MFDRPDPPHARRRLHPRSGPEPGRPSSAAVLDLQRSAGNAAVARRLARMPQDQANPMTPVVFPAATQSDADQLIPAGTKGTIFEQRGGDKVVVTITECPGGAIKVGTKVTVLTARVDAAKLLSPATRDEALRSLRKDHRSGDARKDVENALSGRGRFAEPDRNELLTYVQRLNELTANSAFDAALTTIASWSPGPGVNAYLTQLRALFPGTTGPTIEAGDPDTTAKFSSGKITVKDKALLDPLDMLDQILFEAQNALRAADYKQALDDYGTLGPAGYGRRKTAIEYGATVGAGQALSGLNVAPSALAPQGQAQVAGWQLLFAGLPSDGARQERFAMTPHSVGESLSTREKYIGEGLTDKNVTAYMTSLVAGTVQMRWFWDSGGSEPWVQDVRALVTPIKTRYKQSWRNEVPASKRIDAFNAMAEELAVAVLKRTTALQGAPIRAQQKADLQTLADALRAAKIRTGEVRSFFDSLLDEPSWAAVERSLNRMLLGPLAPTDAGLRQEREQLQGSALKFANEAAAQFGASFQKYAGVWQGLVPAERHRLYDELRALAGAARGHAPGALAKYVDAVLNSLR